MELLDYINASPTAFHAVKNAADILSRRGFAELSQGKKWSLERGGKYFIKKEHSAIAAFSIGDDFAPEHGVRIIAAHTDSPGIKVKPGGCLTEAGCVKLNTECYGGMILSTWLDRPLSLAGLVVAREAKTGRIEERLVNINRPLMAVPNAAIHLVRDMNDGYKYDKRDLKPVLALINGEFESKGRLESLLREELRNGAEILGESAEILDFELYLYDSQGGCLFGRDDEFISSARLDDLWMVWAGLEALTGGGLCADTLSVLLCFDNEEVGSGTARGAGSCFARDLLERITSALSGGREDFYAMCAGGMAISADLAHATHPNYPSLHDEANRPVLGGGPVVKFSANQRYATTAATGAAFREVCERAGVPCQTFVNRSDMAGGSTIGPMLASQLGMAVVDVGAAVLGMHSIRETGAVRDGEYMVRAFREFYQFS